MTTELDGAVPVSQSEIPTVAVRLDPERTLSMEPVVLAQLCAQTQVSQRRRILPLGLEYSVHVELAADPPVAPLPAASAPPAVAPERRRIYLLQLLALLLCPLLGLSGGAGLAWQLSRLAARPRADRAARPPRPPVPKSLAAPPQRLQPSTALPASPAPPALVDPPSARSPVLLQPSVNPSGTGAAGPPLARLACEDELLRTRRAEHFLPHATAPSIDQERHFNADK